jgi:phosphoglycerate dehydrogenase-like enzyme
MTRAICVHREFERVWPLVADRLRERWPDAPFERLARDDDRPLRAVVDDPDSITHLISLGVSVSPESPAAFPALSEAAIFTSGYGIDEDVADAFREAGVTLHTHESEGFWGQSVAECALGLTIDGLRGIPQLHQRIQHDQSPWDYDPDGEPGPGKRGHQFGDDDRFTCGTVAEKRVRVVGVGNIGSRYASFTDALGADVAAYDPYADEPCFHRSGARRVYSLSDLVADAEIFAPLVPPSEETVGLIDESLLNALPEGCLVVLATRARVVDTDVLRDRVLSDEPAPAADVWDENPGEPLPLDDPLLGRHNVVHTPHIAGRTHHANREWADRLVGKFTGS